MTTYEEWRVTGDPGAGFPKYDFTWSPERNPDLGDPETGARKFVALIASCGGWPDGPHLQRRTKTVTEWEAIEP
ncbi:hypothetical protein [Krasilnikovia sp. MM14-A1259]|uniref:hypothetical protein n=1 Tax=Krasilnikovia sp. MM14-A1259 TaxID=3373539 RepID=UPI0038184E99